MTKRLVFEKVVWLSWTVATSAKLPQLGPEQRSIRYRLIPLVSVEACQERSIWVEPTGLACRFEGSLGAVVSGGAAVVEVGRAACRRRLWEAGASLARTREE